MTKTFAFLLMVSLAACRGEAEVRYSGDAMAPELVALDIDPGIMVVANSDEPIFYVDNTYYLYRDDRWYRSGSHRVGWKRVENPPDRIRRIDQPLAYVHFRHGTSAQRTTLNQRDQVPPPPAPDRSSPPESVQPDRAPADPMREPMREPNPQGPNQPVPNTPPPHQVPPSPDRDPSLSAPSSTRPLPPDRVPSTPPTGDRPSHQIAPDPDRAPTSPSPPNSDQRPASDDSSAHDHGDHSKQKPDPAQAERNKKRDRTPASPK
jgi:hypothetical protein